MLQSIRQINPVLRAVGVIGIVAALVTSITFAALQSQATLTNNTISTASADLRLWDGDSFETSAPGFNVSNLIPGTASDPQLFYFKNAGAALDLTANIPVAPTYSGIGDFSKVYVTLDCQGDADADGVKTDIAALLAGQVDFGVTLPANSQGVIGETDNPANCSAVVDIDPATVSGSSATIDNFNIVFTGTAVSEPEEVPAT